ncbi:hyaluronan binding protein 4 S homeolog isoform X3 [Xenopus laevis]|uniref:Hyaluronan binding protein 4 S homeolog isoform X3 n=2 Tax=Xenopus laevis TaxID=8355 RepID=A0A9W2AJ16_XENLA|nr:hyaluronan binding protein 4 S homeolog isoform X3 [Xenopus laevis]
MRLETMKQTPSSPVNIAMQDSFGCAVENRFQQLLDDESDPLDFLYQSAVEVTHRKKKEEGAAKKNANQKSGKKESQKDRKAVVVGGSTDVKVTQQTGQKRAPKNTEKVTQNENVDSQVKVDRTERRTAFREVRPNIMDRSAEYSIEKPMEIMDQDKQMRNYGGRGGMRGRGRGGFPRNTESDNLRGKREFDRHSGSDRAEIEAVPVEEQVETTETEATEEHGKVSEETNDDGFSQEMSLDEWKLLQDQNRSKTELNLRKPETSVPSKAVVIHKSKYKNNISENEEESQYCFRKPVNDITAQLDINFGSLARPSRGRGGGGRGRVRREEAFPHDVINVLADAPNPDDPEDFPALA